MLPRIAITDVAPVVEHGRYPAKATVDEDFPVRANVFRDGHGHVGAGVVPIGPDGVERRTVTMTDLGNDAYEVWVAFDEPGAWSFRIESWADPYATWVHDATLKLAADVDTALMLADGASLLKRASVSAPVVDARVLDAALDIIDSDTRTPPERLAAATTPEVRNVLTRNPLRDQVGSSATYPVFGDRERALVGAWYEFFPRSVGTLRAAADRLD
ncbi:MAG: DUF3416 domain-containing protein, partial [Actinomycetia bacterium]|nr:DUF3416 domain-containing protein [Actinomycetes bacterium]